MASIGGNNLVLLLIVFFLLNISTAYSYNLNVRSLNIVTKKIAAAALISLSLVGLPDQIFAFSTNAIAHAAEDTKSIFDGFYADPNHPGCLVCVSV